MSCPFSPCARAVLGSAALLPYDSPGGSVTGPSRPGPDDNGSGFGHLLEAPQDGGRVGTRVSRSGAQSPLLHATYSLPAVVGSRAAAGEVGLGPSTSLPMPPGSVFASSAAIPAGGLAGNGLPRMAAAAAEPMGFHAHAAAAEEADSSSSSFVAATASASTAAAAPGEADPFGLALALQASHSLLDGMMGPGSTHAAPGGLLSATSAGSCRSCGSKLTERGQWQSLGGSSVTLGDCCSAGSASFGAGLDAVPMDDDASTIGPLSAQHTGRGGFPGPMDTALLAAAAAAGGAQGGALLMAGLGTNNGKPADAMAAESGVGASTNAALKRMRARAAVLAASGKLQGLTSSDPAA